MINKDLKIEIRPIPNRRNIREFSPQLEYFSQSHTIGPFVDPVTRRFATGLDDKDIAYLEELGFPHDLRDDLYTPGEAHPLWESRNIRIDLISRPMFLYPGRNAYDFIKYKYLQVNNYIYKSEEEMETGSKPEATHYIYDENAAISAKAAEIERQERLNVAISKLSIKRRKDLVMIILDEDVSTKTDDYITVKLQDIISTEEGRRELENLISMPVEEVSLKSEIKSAIQKNVLVSKRSGIFYFELNLGYNVTEVMEHLSKPENQELYLSIKSKL